MEKLLHWSIVNAQDDKSAIAKAGQPDPKLLEQLFGMGGPDEPTLMKQAMAVITNPEADLENKLIAFDNFEMLIENLDNANNIENMKLWNHLLSSLDEPEADIRTAALSVIGTAAQNNTPTQDSFSKYDSALRKLVDLAKDPEEPNSVRTKAFYALSNLVRNHSNLAQQFLKLDGLDLIAPVLTDSKSNSKLKMRALSLLSAFLTSVSIDAPLVATLRKDGVIDAAIVCLHSEADINILDRVLNFLSQLVSSNIKFNDQEIQKLELGIQDIEKLRSSLNEEDFLAVKCIL